VPDGLVRVWVEAEMTIFLYPSPQGRVDASAASGRVGSRRCAIPHPAAFAATLPEDGEG